MRKGRRRVFGVLTSLLFLGYIGPSFGQGTVTSGGRSRSDVPLGAASIGSEIRVLDQLADRSGAIASIAIINQTNSDALLVGVALLCDAKGLPSNGTSGENDRWLFGIPLWHSMQTGAIRSGVNVFDLSIQGYEVQKPDAAEAKRHFSYALTMIRTRTLDLATLISDPSAASAFRRRGLEFTRALVGANENDVPSKFQALRSFDDFIDCRIREKALTNAGVAQSAEVKLPAIDLIFWLGNYVRPEDLQAVEQFMHVME